MPIKPSIPKGTRDFSATDIAKRNFLKQVLRQNFEAYGFEPIETPTFERTETLLGKYGDEGDRLIFRILNSGEKVKKANIDALAAGKLGAFADSVTEKALRYDLTVPFARYVAQYQNDIVFPFRRYQIQPVWRADRPQHGRFQEFVQCDADIIGDRSLVQELEVIQLYDKVFSDLKLTGVNVRLNHRKILAGLAAAIGAPDQLIAFTVALDKLDKIGIEGVEKELINQGFATDVVAKLNPILSLEGNAEEKLDQLKLILADHPEALEGIEELNYIFKTLQKQGLQCVSLDVDLTLARGLNYYTGMIVEVRAPESVKMGSIGGGGRYDDLAGSFGLKDKSGIGISFGFDRIFLILEELNLFPKEIVKRTQLLFLHTGEAGLDWCINALQNLRQAGLAAEIYPSAAKFKKQLNYAHQKQIPFVLIYGEEEQAQGVFVLKNMTSGHQKTHPLITPIASLLSN